MKTKKKPNPDLKSQAHVNCLLPEPIKLDKVSVDHKSTGQNFGGLNVQDKVSLDQVSLDEKT